MIGLLTFLDPISLPPSSLSEINLKALRGALLSSRQKRHAYPANLDVLVDSGESSEERLHYPVMDGGARDYFYHPPVVPEGDLPDGNMILACEVRDFTEGFRPGFPR
jgi:hypothetical protein